MLQLTQNIFNNLQPNKATRLSCCNLLKTSIAQNLIRHGWPCHTLQLHLTPVTSSVILHSLAPHLPQTLLNGFSQFSALLLPTTSLLHPFTLHPSFLAKLSLFSSKEHGAKALTTALINLSYISSSQSFPLRFSHSEEGSEKLIFQNSTHLVREKWKHVIHRSVLNKIGLMAHGSLHVFISLH